MTPTIGFTTKYYTLWEVSEPQLIHTAGETFSRVYYQYLQNLSFDVDKARQKMVERYGDGNFTEDFTLRANRSFYVTTKVDSPNETIQTQFQFGKYRGVNFDSVNDLDYKVWYIRNVDKDKFPNLLVKNLIQCGQLFEHDGMLVTESELRERVSNLIAENLYQKGLFYTNGEKVEVSGRVRSNGGYDSMYGYVNVVEIVTDDNKVVYITGSYQKVSVGDVITVKGTVKWNQYWSNYHNTEVKRTELKRAKIVKYEFMSESTKYLLQLSA